MHTAAYDDDARALKIHILIFILSSGPLTNRLEFNE